jgi:hypothetical protein
MNEIEKSLIKLHNYCKKENYLGYSLYDSHKSPIPFKKFGITLSFLINQVNKRSPINFRKILSVKKGINPKGYGLFLHAYTLLHSLTIIDKTETKQLSEYFFNWLINNPSSGYSGYCWGYDYYWPKKDGSDVPAFTPSVVVTGFIARALLSYYLEFKNEKVKKILKSSAQFVLNDVFLYKGKDGYCFSYTPLKKDLTINANLLAAEILAYSDYLNNEYKYQDYINKVIDFTLNTQNQDGSWYYSYDVKTGKPKKQIDFHQGYVIESLYRLSNICSYNKEKIDGAIQKGLEFYYNNQFTEEGFSLWRYPKKWPIDIHNQSQGIITFSKLNRYNKKYLPFANRIAIWTIHNMQNKKGNFYYQKWPIITNKISYLRWNQGWMLLSLTNLSLKNTVSK